MPKGNGTGPIGQGAGRGAMGGNRPGSGVGGNCVCPSCGAKVSHQRGLPCYSVTCPKCGVKMVKE
jgi:hypothetical protein